MLMQHMRSRVRQGDLPFDSGLCKRKSQIGFRTDGKEREGGGLRLTDLGSKKAEAALRIARVIAAEYVEQNE